MHRLAALVAVSVTPFIPLHSFSIAWQETAQRGVPQQKLISASLVEAERLDKEVKNLFNEGRYSEALPAARHSLAIREQSLEPDHLDNVISLNNLGGVLQMMGEFAEAKPLYERALAIRERMLGRFHPDTARSLNNLGQLLRKLGELQDSKNCHERALVIFKSHFKPDNPEIATTLNNLGSLLYEMGDPKGAKAKYEEALTIREKLLPPDHPELAASLNNMGLILRKLGDLQGARIYYERALTAFERAFGSDHPNTALILNNLGVLLNTMGDLEACRPYLERALAIREKALGRTHFQTAESLHNLGSFYRTLGDLRGAKSYFERALSILEVTLGSNHPKTASSLNNLGELLSSLGDFEQARLLCERALTIRLKTLGPGHPETAYSYDSLGDLDRILGDLAQARSSFERALAIREKAFGPHHPEIARSLNLLGTVSSRQGDLQGSKVFYERALEIYEKTVGAHHPDTAQVLNNLGILLHSLRDLEAAKACHQRALTIRETVLGLDHPDTAQSLNNLAGLLRELGDIRGAQSAYDRALGIFRESGLSDHHHTAQLLMNMAVLNQDTGDLQQALELLEQGLDTEERHLLSVLPFASPHQKDTFLRNFRGSASYAVSMHARSAQSSRRALELALTTVLRRKGRALEVNSVQWQALRQRLSPEDRNLFDILSQAESQRAYLIFHPESLAAENRRHLIAEQEEQIKSTSAELVLHSNAFIEHLGPVTMESVQQALPPDTALVEFFRYSPFNTDAPRDVRWKAPRYVAYIMHLGNDPQWVDLGDATAIEGAVAGFRQAIREPGTSFKKRSRLLDRLLMEEIRPKLGDAKRLLISPDGVLNLISFAALVDESGRYLIERYSLSYVSSGRDLLRPSSAPARQPALIIGGADFDAQARFAPGEATRSSDLAELKFDSLPGTAVEVQEIGRLLPGSHVLTGAAAHEAALKEVQGPRILHLATHGFFLPDQPFEPPDPLLGSVHRHLVIHFPKGHDLGPRASQHQGAAQAENSFAGLDVSQPGSTSRQDRHVGLSGETGPLPRENGLR